MKYKTPRKVFDRYFTPPEERALFAAVRKFMADPLARRDLAWMLFARHTGVRVSVLAGMTCQDARDALRGEHFHVRGEINKGGRAYRIFLVKPARQALLDLLTIRRRHLDLVEDPDAPLIVTRRGKRMSVRNFEHRMEGWIKAAGLRGGSPHWLRHTLAKRIMKNSTAQDPRAVVMHALGQSDINNTVIYTMPDMEDIEAAMREAAA